ncbi:MAG: hypothetical protein ACTSRT_21535 [Promethearchaeota archaeon]
MVGFAIFSNILSYCLLNRTSGAVSFFFHVLIVPAIMFHEFCHVIMCLLTNTHVEKASLLSIRKVQGSGGNYSMSGQVRINGNRTTFLKTLLIGLAPLYILFWIFFFVWDQLKNPNLEYGFALYYVYLMFCATLAAGPSFQDLTTILTSFRYDVKYSFYQIFLVFISIGTTVLVIDVNQLVFIHEIYIYAIITFFYFVYKFSFLIAYKLFKSRISDSSLFLSARNRPEKPKRYKPKRPKKGEEGSW